MGNWQCEMKHRPMAGGAFRPDPSVMLFDNLFADGESQAGSFIASGSHRALNLVKLFKMVFSRSLGMPGPSSITEIWIVSPSGNFSTFTSIVAFANRRALLNKLRITSVKRSGSVEIAGRFLQKSVWIVRGLSEATDLSLLKSGGG